MTDLDSSFESIQSIIESAQKDENVILSEEDAKIKIINRMLIESLGWQYEDIETESRHENGFSDYILHHKDNPAILIEAKRSGKVIIKTADRGRVRYLKISGPALASAMPGIDQAFSYAAPNGLNLSVLTDGVCWVFFKNFIPGSNYKDKQAIVFPSFNSVLSDFSVFYELLSKDSFEKKLFNFLFDNIHNNRASLEQNLSPSIPDSSIHITRKAELAFDLDKVFDEFFTRLSDEEDKDLLLECFVESRESKIADYSLEKMTKNVLGNMSPADKDINKELEALFNDRLAIKESSSDSGKTVFIVGPTGSGKTTFIDRFFEKTLSKPIKKHCEVFRINCLDSTGGEQSILYWLTEQLIKLITHNVYSGSIKFNELRGLYNGEYNDRAGGTHKHLYERDPLLFKEDFGRYLETVVHEDREGFLRRLISDIVSNRKKLPVFVVDNTDEFSLEYKKEIFQFIQSLKRHAKHCLIIFPITDKSAWTFSKTEIFTIYSSKSFFLPTPSPRDVFRKRIDFISNRLSESKDIDGRDDYFTKRGIRISIQDLSAFTEVIEKVFVEYDYASKTIGELSNYNIRRTLALSQRIITSSVFKVDDLVKSYLLRKPIYTRYDRFIEALLKGDYQEYKIGDIPEIYPIFQIDADVKQSPLLKLRILFLLLSIKNTGTSIDEKHVSIESINSYFDALGVSELAIDRSLKNLLEARLVEPYDISMRSLSPGQRLSITFKGQAHLRLAVNDKIFFYQMSLVTPILDESISLKIKSIYKNKKGDRRERYCSIRSLFLDYLMDQDTMHVKGAIDREQYDCQNDMLMSLKKFHKEDDSKEESNLSDARSFNNVEMMVNWFDADEKKYGFVRGEGFEDGVFIHLDTLKSYGINDVNEGDKLLCNISKGNKGLYISQVHDMNYSDDITVKECEIIQVFEDRDYGIARLSLGNQEVIFDKNLFKKKSIKLEKGAIVTAQVRQEPQSDILQMIRIMG